MSCRGLFAGLGVFFVLLVLVGLHVCGGVSVSRVVVPGSGWFVVDSEGLV